MPNRVAHNPDVAGSLPAHATLSMPARPFLLPVWSNSQTASAGAPTSLSVRDARFLPASQGAGPLSSRPAPAGIRRDTSSSLPTQAVWAPRAAARGFCS